MLILTSPDDTKQLNLIWRSAAPFANWHSVKFLLLAKHNSSKVWSDFGINIFRIPEFSKHSRLKLINRIDELKTTDSRNVHPRKQAGEITARSLANSTETIAEASKHPFSELGSVGSPSLWRSDFGSMVTSVSLLHSQKQEFPIAMTPRGSAMR
jgi:hypothetical protein